jgi:hypothetical protein
LTDGNILHTILFAASNAPCISCSYDFSGWHVYFPITFELHYLIRLQ